jgi:hypothetical protein
MASDFISVCAAYAAAGSTNFVRSTAGFHHLVQLAVVGHDHVSVFAHKQAAINIYTGVGQHLDFRNKGLRINYNAIANDTGEVIVEDSGRNQVKDNFAAFHYYGVTGIVAALVAAYNIRVVGKEVNNLPLTFIAPLAPNYYD